MSPKTRQLPKKEAPQAAPSPLRRLLPFFVIGAALLLLGAGIVLVRRANGPTNDSDIPTLAADMPRLAVDQKLLDFGKVPLDIPIKATFKLTNVGDQPLRILNQPVVEVKQGC